jgi:hypothetical protein
MTRAPCAGRCIRGGRVTRENENPAQGSNEGGVSGTLLALRGPLYRSIRMTPRQVALVVGLFLLLLLVLPLVLS